MATSNNSAPESSAPNLNDIDDVLTLLAQRAVDHMSLAELESLSQVSDIAEDEARSLAILCEGLACLIHNDGETKLPAGNFQSSGDVFELLVMLSKSMNAIAALIRLTDQAKHEADERRKKVQA